MDLGLLAFEAVRKQRLFPELKRLRWEPVNACWLGRANRRNPFAGGIYEMFVKAYLPLLGGVFFRRVNVLETLHHVCECPRCGNPFHLAPLSYEEHYAVHRGMNAEEFRRRWFEEMPSEVFDQMELWNDWKFRQLQTEWATFPKSIGRL